MPDIKRVVFGLPILDEALNGGIPKGNVVLLSGGAGTGKSTLCLHFLAQGLRSGEKAIYISTEQSLSDLTRQSFDFEPNFERYAKEGKLKFLLVDVLNQESFLQKIYEEINTFQPTRVVIDSLSTFSEFAATSDFARQILLQRGGVAQRSVDQIVPSFFSEKTLSKRMLGSLISKLRSFSATVLLTSELPDKVGALSSDGISEFLADGVIALYYFELGEVEEHALKIRKMRYSGHEKKALLYDLTSHGFKLKKDSDLVLR